MYSPELDEPSMASKSVIVQPDGRCGICGRDTACHEHCLQMFMARKSMIMPGPAGITYQAEVRKISATYRVCADCEKKRAEQESAIKRDARVWISGLLCYLIIVASVVVGVCLGWRWYSLLMLIPGGVAGGLARVLVDWLLGVKQVPALYEGHRFIRALEEAGWSVGSGPSRFDIKSLPEHWPDEQRKIDAERKAERDALKESLKPKTVCEKIAMWFCIAVLLALLVGIVYVVVRF